MQRGRIITGVAIGLLVAPAGWACVALLGGAFVVAEGQTPAIYFSNFADQRLCRQGPGDEVQAITPQTNLRYADGVIIPGRGRMICVREDHTASGQEATNPSFLQALIRPIRDKGLGR